MTSLLEAEKETKNACLRCLVCASAPFTGPCRHKTLETRAGCLVSDSVIPRIVLVFVGNTSGQSHPYFHQCLSVVIFTTQFPSSNHKTNHIFKRIAVGLRRLLSRDAVLLRFPNCKGEAVLLNLNIYCNKLVLFRVITNMWISCNFVAIGWRSICFRSKYSSWIAIVIP